MEKTEGPEQPSVPAETEPLDAGPKPPAPLGQKRTLSWAQSMRAISWILVSCILVLILLLIAYVLASYGLPVIYSLLIVGVLLIAYGYHYRKAVPITDPLVFTLSADSEVRALVLLTGIALIIIALGLLLGM